MFRYRLSSLLLIVGVVAVGLAAWRQYFAPYVGGVHMDGANVELTMTDQYIRRACSDDPYYVQSLLGPTGGGVPLLEHAHISIPLFVPLVLMALFLGVVGGACFVLKRLSSSVDRRVGRVEQAGISTVGP